MTALRQPEEPRVAEAPAEERTTLWRQPGWIVWLLALAMTVVFALVLLRPRAAEDPLIETASSARTATTVRFLMEQQWLVRMKLAEVDVRRVTRRIRSPGRIVPAFGHHAVVAPPVGGILSGRTLPRVGQRVERGAVLALVSETPTAAETLSIRAAQAMLEIEKARLEAERRRLTEAANEARARMMLAITEADHAQRLFERNAYSLNQYQRAQHEQKIAETDYDAAKKQIEALDAIKLPEISQPSSPTPRTVPSPISGVVTKVFKNPGERAAAGEPVLEVVNLDKVWVEAPVFERDLRLVSRTSKASFTTAAFRDMRFEGSVVSIGAVFDERSRALTVLFELPNPDGLLRIGMIADLSLATEDEFTASLVPKEAILDIEGRKYAYVLLSGEEFERRELKLSDEVEDQVVVEAGLVAGERVVTRGNYQIYLQELAPARLGVHTHE
jgi:membrane fusion protein, heavy metal efflux system